MSDASSIRYRLGRPCHPRFAEPRTKEEWREYLKAEPIPRPVMPSFNEYLEMSPEAKARFNRQRNAYHSAGALVRTAKIDEVLNDVARLLETNRYQQPGARRGRVIDGPPDVGKSTLVKWIGADFENELLQTDPDEYVIDGGVPCIRDYTPVVYVSIDSGATPKGVCIDFAEFLNVEYRDTKNKDIITHVIARAMRAAGTELVIIDELSFLDLQGKMGKSVNQQLKSLANYTAATFIYTGVDLEASGLFLEGDSKPMVDANSSRGGLLLPARSTQTAARNNLVKLTPLKIGTKEEKTEWCSVIGAMEAQTVLYKHRAGSLVREQWSYLHDRTGGVIASLSHLLREAAVEAVKSGEEEIAREILDRIVIDRQAQKYYEKQLAKRRKKRRPAAAESTDPT